MNLIDLKTMRRGELPPSGALPARVCAALGSFDGVHIGHAALIGRAITIAKERGLRSAVFTFTEEPSVIPGKSRMSSITTLREKLSLIASLGADFALLEDFSRIRDYSPERFVNEFLRGECKVECAVCGFNFRFGAKGAGDSKLLASLMPEGCCEIVAPITLDGNAVSSSAIRALIENGKLEEASRLLGHPFSIELPVIHGKQLGRTIGIPTVNQNFPEHHIIPKPGIYASLAEINGISFPAVTNIGRRPTTDGDFMPLNCETHIIGFDGDLYNENVRISLFARLRDELKFPNIECLKRQINLDIAAATTYFNRTDVEKNRL